MDRQRKLDDVFESAAIFPVVSTALSFAKRANFRISREPLHGDHVEPRQRTLDLTSPWRFESARAHCRSIMPDVNSVR